MLRHGRSEFLLQAEPERSEGGLSEEIKNREGMAAGGATFFLNFTLHQNQNTYLDMVHQLI